MDNLPNTVVEDHYRTRVERAVENSAHE